MLGQNKIYVFALALGILAFGIKLYTDKRPRIADLSSIENLLKTDLVGSTGDTKAYFVASYAIFKNFLPVIEHEGKRYFVCYRPTSSLVYTPFMFLFREYFPIFSILIFSTLTYISSAYLLKSIGLNFIPSVILLLFVFAFTFYHVPTLLLEPPTFSLLAISIALYIKGRILLSGVFLFFASLIRPEFFIVGLLYLLKTRKLSLSFLLIPPIFAITLQNICGDQSNFYSWTYRAYQRNVKKDYNLDKLRSDLKNCLLDKYRINVDQDMELFMRRVYPFSKYYSDCWKELAKSNIRLEIDKLVKYFVINVSLFSIIPKVKFFKFLFPLSMIFGTLTILALILYLKKDWFIPISYTVMVMLYVMYYPFGLFDFERLKLYVLPFEIMMIAQMYKDKVQSLIIRIASIRMK